MAQHDLLSIAVAAIDHFQRWRLGIREFSDDPRCIFRLGLVTARREATLSDGTAMRAGDTVGALHLWNEHMPQIPPGGADLAWARAFKRALEHSLRLLARHVEASPELDGVHAFGGSIALLNSPATIRLLHRLGLEVLESAPPRTPVEKGVDAVTRLWTWLLRWAFNRGSARGVRPRDLHYRSAWISRCTLLARYDSPGGAPAEIVRPPL